MFRGGENISENSGEKNEPLKWFLVLLDSFTYIQKTIMLLKYYDKFSHEKIADILECDCLLVRQTSCMAKLSARVLSGRMLSDEDIQVFLGDIIEESIQLPSEKIQYKLTKRGEKQK